MGVTGLWKLIEPCGKPVPVETLEGKVLAVDISIWLHQVVKGFQDSKGSALNNAHLLGLFHRLCKLLYYRVRPVFIFDGCTPQLKRDTIARRQQQRSKLSNEADRIQSLLLQSLAKEKVVQQALGINAELLLKSPGKRPTVVNSSKNDEDDMFKLPELPPASTIEYSEADSQMEDLDKDYTSANSTSDSSFDESTARHSYNASLQAIDVRSQHFKNLPADVRHEILTDIKETRKQSSWGRLHELPARSDDFCSFQMKRLLKRRAVQESLEEAQQEMGGHTLTYSELSEFFSEEGIVTPTVIEESTRQISSDEHTRFLLVRDLKKKAQEDSQRKTQIKFETVKEEDELDTKPCSSSKIVKLSSESMNNEPKKELGAEYDTDLALALALSLEETSKVYDEKDYDYDSDQDLQLNRDQSKQLRHAAKGPARSYMIEYGGMNEDEVKNIMETTQQHNDTLGIESIFPCTKLTQIDLADNSIDEAKQVSFAIEESKKEQIRTKEAQTIDSGTDSDLEEVIDANEQPNKKSLQIRVDIKEQLDKDDDLFADIFENENDLQNKRSYEERETEISNDRDIVEDEIIEICKKTPEGIIKRKNKELNEFGNGSNTNNENSDKIITKTIEDVCTKSETDIKRVSPLVPLDSILDELKKQTKKVKNIKFDIKEEKEDKPVLNTILDEIKQQTNEVKYISLESNKLNSLIELSSDEEDSKVRNPFPVTDTIEVFDSDNEKREEVVSPAKTPNKSKAITDYFETSYRIKRTPDKAAETIATTPPATKVTQPFYVKRTPKSGRKHAGGELSDEGPSPSKKSCKAAKSLFETKEQKEPNPLSSEEIVKNAAETLKAKNTTEELRDIAENLAQERRELETERNRQDRMGMSISNRMSNDCQELLRLFGMPYIVAPMEAEAQCAFLNAVDLTNGTITDDSDIWLFGGRTVYKNFFAQNKHVLEYRAEQIEQTFNCNRGKLIQLACLVGSDYTTGIHGVGAVTALEILASFSTSQQIESTSSAVLSTLVKFRDWWQAHKTSNLPIGSSARLALLKKLKNIDLHEGFPSMSVIEAYMTPKVDDNRDSFSWGSPDVESIREFTRKSFGWTTSKTDDILMPVIKKINEKKIQGSIRNYFTSKSALKVQQPQVSKRVQKAIDKMSGGADEETSEKPNRVVRRTRNKASATTAKDSFDEASTSKTQSKSHKTACIPNTREMIPQRERDFEQMRQNKAKAAEVLKASAKAKTFK